MTLTATEFRKSLFSSLERALQGEAVEVVYKGANLKLIAVQPTPKLARAVRRHALVGTDEDYAKAKQEMSAELQAEWEKDWQEQGL